MNEVVTKRDLADKGIEALNPSKHGAILASRRDGGVTFANVSDVIEVAKLMSVAGNAVGPHLRNNPGACLRIVFQAVEWGMSPWEVADASYEVGSRIAYMSQLVHAVIEARAPLKKRLECAYSGKVEDGTRAITITGTFTDGEKRTYTSPAIKDIRVKNSPLWKDDPDQQLFYYGTRAWSRRWCPDVLKGIYAGEELRENPQVGREEAPPESLRQRLIEGAVDGSQGFDGAQIEQEVGDAEDAQPVTEAEDVNAGAAEAEEAEAAPAKRKAKGKAKAAGSSKAKGSAVAEPAESAPEPAPAPAPKNAAEWKRYCAAWLKTATDYKSIRQRWNDERGLRNACGVTQDERVPIQNLMLDRCRDLGEPE